MLSFRKLTVFLEFLWLGTSVAATCDTREEEVRERLAAPFDAVALLIDAFLAAAEKDQ